MCSQSDSLFPCPLQTQPGGLGLIHGQLWGRRSVCLCDCVCVFVCVFRVVVNGCVCAYVFHWPSWWKALYCRLPESIAPFNFNANLKLKDAFLNEDKVNIIITLFRYICVCVFFFLTFPAHIVSVFQSNHLILHQTYAKQTHLIFRAKLHTLPTTCIIPPLPCFTL